MKDGHDHGRLASRRQIEAERIAAERDVTLLQAAHALFEIIAEQAQP